MLSCYSDRTGGTRSEGPTTRAKQVNTEAGCHTGFRSAVFHSARVQCSASSIQQLFVDSLTVSNKTLVRLQIRLQCQIQTQSCRFISIPFFNGRLPKCSNQLNFFDQGQRWCFSKEKKKRQKLEQFSSLSKLLSMLSRRLLGKEAISQGLPETLLWKKQNASPSLILT